MTMFSMKPKFDLAAFLEEANRKGARAKTRDSRRSQSARRKWDRESDSDQSEKGEADAEK